MQLHALLQVWLNLEVFGMPPQASVEAARFASYSFPDSFEPHAAFLGRLNVEERLGLQQISDLRMLGHDVASGRIGRGARVQYASPASGLRERSKLPRILVARPMRLAGRNVVFLGLLLAAAAPDPVQRE